MKSGPTGLETEVALHALGWLFVGNLVGMLLATLLLVPQLGGLLGSLSYGRWMPLHLNTMLYGWCALPLIGLLMRLYLRSSADRKWARWAIAGWSGSLAFGCASWLNGQSSGKLFLEWSGAARIALITCMALLAAALTVGWVRSAPRSWATGHRLRLVGTGLLLAGLFALPATMYAATSPELYPPYNPDSGGATGGSLLGSGLAVVAIFLLTPVAMGLRPRHGWRHESRILLLLALHFGWFALLEHGNRSHHEILQIVSLASLAIWPPLLIGLFRRFDWPPGSRRWLLSLSVWGVLLVATGVAMFLPGILERLKFTHVMVAHAHLAMACMSSSYLFLVLLGLLQRTPLESLLADGRAFLLWQLGNALHLLSLTALGLLEVSDPGALFQADPLAVALLGLRATAGLLVLTASGRWLAGAFRLARTAPRGWSSTVTRAQPA